MARDAIDWNNVGIALAGEKRHREAVAAYNRAISLDPSNPIFHKNKNRALEAIEREKNRNQGSVEVDEVIEPVRKSKLGYAIDWNNRASNLFKEGRIEEAIVAYDRAISLDPTYPIFWKNKAKALRTLGKNEESESAQRLFESIQTQNSLNPVEDAISWNNKGYSLAEQGNHPEAFNAYTFAIKIDPNFADAWNNLGYSLAELGRIDEAITACYRAVELKPELAYPWIERLLYLPELLQNHGNVVPLNNVVETETESESEDSGKIIFPRFCEHSSGLIKMEPVFVRSKEDMNQFLAYGWICPDCGKYQKT